MLLPAPEALAACVLTDVGHSRSLGTREQADTRSGLGTVGFQPPELAHGEPHTRAVDMYQLGVLIFVLVAGAGPHAVNIREVLHENAHDAGWDQLAINAGACSVARRCFVQGMMANDADDRGTPRSALEDPWLNGEVA